MSTKRRTRSQQKKVGGKSSDKSSSDSEHQKTMEIITRLSQKYLKTSSLSSCQSNSGVESYDGDAENTTDASDLSLCSPVDTFEFTDSDDLENVVVLSPKPTNKSTGKKKGGSVVKGKKKDNKPKSTQKENVNVKSKRKQASSTKTTKDATGAIKELPQTVKANKKPYSCTQGTKRKAVVEVYKLFSPNVSAISVCNSSMETEICADSGIFVSPPPPLKKVKLVAKDTSTPTNVPQAIHYKDNCFGFSKSKSPLSVISPISHQPTPTSDYSSMSSIANISTISPSATREETTSSMEVHETELDVSQIALTTKVYKASKKKRPRGRYSSARVDMIAEKLNNEFDEIEMYELSID